MKKTITLAITSLIFLLASSFSYAANPPKNFRAAKIIMAKHIEHDRNDIGELYCGCKWDWVGESGGRIRLKDCGIDASFSPTRSARIEAEHQLPISWASHRFPCWKEGGRTNCQKTDPTFNIVEADLHNLIPVVGSLNQVRSNYPFGVVNHKRQDYGSCPFKVDSQQRVAEPMLPEAKGVVARANLYMELRYGINLGSSKRILQAWAKQNPPTAYELERDRRIKKFMGHSNPFVTGEAYKPNFDAEKYRFKGFDGKDGYHFANKLPIKSVSVETAKAAGATVLGNLKKAISDKQTNSNTQTNNTSNASASSNPILGNRNSMTYHLPVGCPSYNRIAEHNRVKFNTESAAVSAGYKKAGNCR